MELMGCQGLAVPAEVMHHVVRVESSFNPYAIGVVGGRLVRQPKNLAEALSTVRMLESRGYNFSLGLAQVNRYNLQKYGLTSYERAFEPCANLTAGSQILAECYRRSGADWGKSFSCYYSGNFTTGYRHGYVHKVYASMRQGRNVEASPATPAIEVVGRQARRTVPVSRFPLYSNGVQPAEPAVSVKVQAPAQAVVAVLEQPPALPSRVQQVPTRVVRNTDSTGSGSLFPIVATPQLPVQSAVTPSAPAAPNRVLGDTVEGPVMLGRSGAISAAPQTVPVAVQPAAVAVSEPPQAQQESPKLSPRARRGRDPALVGGQSPEQDGAFVF
jgi:type IV secretion system protein VirB1